MSDEGQTPGQQDHDAQGDDDEAKDNEKASDVDHHVTLPSLPSLGFFAGAKRPNGLLVVSIGGPVLYFNTTARSRW